MPNPESWQKLLFLDFPRLTEGWVAGVHLDTQVHGTGLLANSTALHGWYFGYFSERELAIVLFKLGAGVRFGSVVGSASALEAKPFLCTAIPQHDFVFHAAPGEQR